ncbi:Phospholipid-transporting ATPase [Rhynchospora pubera]|uniref:Phospholipid-transporting ATPase n=1 Tax=Rhynchospora pubera TaxID=906938 RepID=A0AAV8D6L4_9POAL|nr:Phospholipid-transporting ATPase [Rhynchospora pubera]
MRSPEPLLSPPKPGLPPEEPSTSTSSTKLPGPVPSPILKSSSSRRTHSRSYSQETVTFAEILRQSSRPIDFEPNGNGFAPNSTQLPNFLRSSTRRNSGRIGSQRDLSDDEARFIYINEPARTHGSVKFVNNAISTSKYTVITFLPRNLFEQFHRVAYIYFLILGALNFVPQLGVFTPALGILPLAFVLFVTAVKDAYEDFRRHRSDNTENSRTSTVLTDGEFQPKMWKDIQVGDIIRVTNNETLPCDMVLLATSDPTGVAYVQTINLDGESNLKTRYAKQETLSTPPERMMGLVKCEQPNRNIYGFLANAEINGKKVSLGPSNIILRGCELKNTNWIIGVAVYTGSDTKVMLNNSGAPSKRSRLESHMNRETISLSVLLGLICTIVMVLAGIWLFVHEEDVGITPFYRKYDFEGKNKDTYNWYGKGGMIVFTFMSAVILFQVMIPISLYISMELVRLGQAFFMIQDKQMYHKATKSKFQCRALNINEDLGQIRYVFSDKTGTLTENKMEFQCASVYGSDFSGSSDGTNENITSVKADGVVLRPKTIVKTDPKLHELLRNGTGRDADRARDFFLALATCNTIVPIEMETADPNVRLLEYQGESPDEQALVYAAAAYGVMLIERTSGHIIVDVFGQQQSYNVLGLHEFDSDRKRMSVIIGCPDKSVKLFVKGADSSMFTVLDKTLNLDVTHLTETHLQNYSNVGLRTLVIGMRDLTSEEFEEWQSAYERASTALLGRGTQLRAIASKMESDLVLLGATGIEDKLQQGVPEAIEKLRQAGIKVWVLTGDKQETAISIGFSCRLLTGEMNQIVINANSRDSCRKSLADAVALSEKMMRNSGEQQALIIDGNSLVYVLETELEEQLFKVATRCDVVLCCRVAPLQKAGIVALIKNRTDDMTLAIGDGANDVSMIQMADVGIGISGQEGRQAVMASDFAMAQFRFLVPLLLVHGHWNYQRMAYMILYNFYRNAVYVFVLFWFVLYTAFTLTNAINEWSAVLYSVVYTAVPTIVVAILDKDLSRSTLMNHPQLYGSGQREEKYNIKLFIGFMLDSLWQSLVIFFLPYLAYRHTDVDWSGLGDLWILGIVILVNLNLAIDVVRWNWVTHAAIWGSIAATWICVIVIDSIWMLPGFWAIYHMMATWRFWFCLLAVIIVGLIPHFVGKAFLEHTMPSDIQIAREVEKFNNPTGTTSMPRVLGESVTTDIEVQMIQQQLQQSQS